MSVKQENGGLLPTCAIKQETREDANAGVNLTSRSTTRPTFASPTISDVSMIQWPNRNGSRGSLVKGGDSPWPLYINEIAGRSISGNLASSRARFANARRNTVPLLSPDSTSNFALVHQADSTFSLDHELIGPSPTPNFSSPRHSAIFGGRKRPFSISPCSTGSLDLNALIRTSPSSLVAYVNNSRGSSAGSIGHLSPSLLVSNPITLQRIQSRLSRPVSKQRQSTIDNDTTAVVKTEPHDVPRMMESIDLNCHSDRLVKSQLEAVAEENCSSDNEDMITDHATSESAVTESETERRDKPPRVKAKREYFSYPIHEEPHNNQCLWENCREQFHSLDDLVAHINSIHIYQESKKNFVCRWQGCIRACKEFKAQYMLLVHMRRHTGEKPHKCSFEGCEKAYSRLENLKTHLRSHTGERPYVCKFSCGKAFSNASDCAKHENRTHSNARPYVCKNNGCSKCYTDPSSLRKHMKTCTISKKPKQEDTTGTEEESCNELNPSTKSSLPKKTSKCRQKKRAAPPVLMKTNSHDFGYVSSDGGGVVHGFPEWSHPQSSGYDTEYNSWKSDQLPASVVALQNCLSPMSPQQTVNPQFMPSAVPPTQQYTTVTQPVIVPPPVYTVEQHPVPMDGKGNPPHYIIQSQPTAPQEVVNHNMGYKSHTFPTLPNLSVNRNMTHHYSMHQTTDMDSINHRKLSETSSGISSMTANSRHQSLKATPLKAGLKYRKDSADSSFSTDRSSNASSFHSSLTGRSIGQVHQSPYPSPPESRQSSQFSYNCSERSHPASWHGDSNGSTKQLYNGFNCDMGLVNRRPSNVNKTLRHHGSGMLRTKDYVQSLPHPVNTNGFSNMEPLPLPASMRMGPQSPVCGMEVGGMEPGGYADQASPMQVSGDMSCSDVGCLVVTNEAPVKGTQPLCHLEPTQLPPPSYESSIQYKTLQHVSMDHSHHGNMMIGDMANMMYPSKGCYDNGARF